MPIKYEYRDDHIGIIDLGFGDRNTFSIPEINGIIQIFKEKIENNLDIRAILIKSSNPKFFATGPFINEIKDMDKEGARYYGTVLNNMLKHIEETNVPVVCIIKGIVTGIGFDIVSVCDFRFATPDSVFADYSIKYGIISPSLLMLRLNFLIGAQNTKELLLTGREFTGNDLFLFNFLTKLYNADEIDKNVNGFLDIFANLPLDSLRLTKGIFNRMRQDCLKNQSVSFIDIFSEFISLNKGLTGITDSTINPTL